MNSDFSKLQGVSEPVLIPRTGRLASSVEITTTKCVDISVVRD